MTNPNIVSRIHELPDFLRSKIKGQEHTVLPICSVIERGERGLSPTTKPKGSFLFLGPTGVGKTETTKLFNQFLYGANEQIYRFDMSEFVHDDAVKLLLGDENGKTGRLGYVLSKYDHGTLLFDEMEKANPLILDLFLQMLDAARITLGDHKTYDLSKFYIVFTSNIGSEKLMSMGRQPFASIKRAVFSALAEKLRPEMIGRFSDIIIFKSLNADAQRDIALLRLEEEIARMANLGHRIKLDPDAVEFVIRNGIDRKLGARPMNRCVEKSVGDAICASLHLRNHANGIISFDPITNALVIQPEVFADVAAAA